MAHHTPNGMGADRHRERENMRAAASNQTATPPWELAALDHSGEELYRTEYAPSEEAAKKMAAEIDPDAHEGVAKFKAVRTEE